MIDELNKKGYFQKGAMGMDHTGSQMEFVLGRAAMIPCGTWLGSEMKKQMPKDFHMDYINPPILKGGKGDANVVSTGIETWIIPKEAKHPDEAADFFKFMTSLEMAKKFVAQKNTLMSIRGSDQIDLPRDLISPAKCMRNACATWALEYADWYRPLKQNVEDAVAALLNGEVTPKECVDRIEAEAAKIRADRNIPKHKV
jgi:N-acetylglucosamine transport system substrate-binding protein